MDAQAVPSPTVVFGCVAFVLWAAGAVLAVVGPLPSPRRLTAETAAWCVMLGGALADFNWHQANVYLIGCGTAFAFGGLWHASARPVP